MSTDQWDAPIPLARGTVPAFPLEAVPQGLCAFREYCDAVAASYQVPVDLPALLGLGVAGAALAKRIEVHVRADHREPVNLYVAVALESGERKSAVFRQVTAPLVEYEREVNERLAPEIDANRTRRAILEARRKHAEAAAAKATVAAEQSNEAAEARRCGDELRSTPELYALQLIADDATPEAVSRLMFEQGGRIAILSPEGDVFEQMAGRYSKNALPNLGVYLKGHAGDDLRVNRVSRDRPPEYVRRPALSMGLAIQPDVLRGLMDRPGFRGRGLLARFLYSLPASRVGYRLPSGPAAPAPVTAAYSALIRGALQLSPGPWDGCHLAVANADALHHLDRFQQQIERELRDGGSLASMRDWGNKCVGLVVRVAGVFHGLLYADTAQPGREPISAETMLGAIAIGEYAIEHARVALQEMGVDPAIGVARRVLGWIMNTRPATFSVRDAFNALRGTVHTVDGLVEPLRLLQLHNYIRPIPVERQGPGRPPSPRFEVNPAVHAQNEQNTQKPADENEFCEFREFCAGEVA